MISMRKPDGIVVCVTESLPTPHRTVLRGVLVRPEVAKPQLDAEIRPPTNDDEVKRPKDDTIAPAPPLSPKQGPRRFHGNVSLDPSRVGRDAGRIADEIVSHLSGLMNSSVVVTLEINAKIPSGAPDHVVRTVTENCRTLKFVTQGFEAE